MANTFTATHDDVFGTCRVKIGTLTMTDGTGGSSAVTGLDKIFSAVDNSAVQAKISHTGGSIIACTASSADTFEVTIFGK